jgi:hypothetical protein
MPRGYRQVTERPAEAVHAVHYDTVRPGSTWEPSVQTATLGP